MKYRQEIRLLREIREHLPDDTVAALTKSRKVKALLDRRRKQKDEPSAVCYGLVTYLVDTLEGGLIDSAMRYADSAREALLGQN